jgi:hypothetical protein
MGYAALTHPTVYCLSMRFAAQHMLLPGFWVIVNSGSGAAGLAENKNIRCLNRLSPKSRLRFGQHCCREEMK